MAFYLDLDNVAARAIPLERLRPPVCSAFCRIEFQDTTFSNENTTLFNAPWGERSQEQRRALAIPLPGAACRTGSLPGSGL
jgi:hypothetical protein